MKLRAPQALGRQTGSCWGAVYSSQRSWKWIASGTATPAPSRLGWIVAALLTVVSVGVGIIAWKYSQKEPPRVAKFSFAPPERGNFASEFPTIAVSPDGQRIAFEALVDGKRGLWLRDLANPIPRMLATIDGVTGTPFWAPDSRWLGFFDGSKVKKIDVIGGRVFTLADTGVNLPSGGSWNQNGVIIYSRLNSALFQVSAAGGPSTPVTELDRAGGETAHFAPFRR